MPKMNVNLYVIEDYENKTASGFKKTNLVLSEVEWAKTNPILSDLGGLQMNLKSLAGKSCLSSLFSEHTRWAHIVKSYPFTT